MKIYSLILILFSFHFFGQQLISGRVIDDTSGSALAKVNITVSDTLGTSTDNQGMFQIQVESPKTILHFTHIGYDALIIPAQSVPPIVRMQSAEIILPELSISTTRVVPGVTPVSYSTLTADEIRSRYTVEDVPMLLSGEPGVYAYSESGNGTGYSYVSIRGFDQSRIAVMLDNVPLNDNESHQVYWVDHGDILSNAKDVEIQRGVGNSLYGSTAFGGSVNVETSIRSETENWSLAALAGSYNTQKYRLEYQSGNRLGNNRSLTLRGSVISSNGYREDSKSDQSSFFAGLEFNTGKITHQLRMNIGKEVSRLQWDGISGDLLSDRSARRGKMDWTEPFTDDFLQQIYSLNSLVRLNEKTSFKNTLYLVKGSGYYKVQKYGRDYYSYNLDINNEYPDSLEWNLQTDLMRRKWIQNLYYGLVPTFTFQNGHFRNDLGLELRQYSGDHFGEVLQVSDPILGAIIPDVYEYYNYTGTKFSTTIFNHFVYSPGAVHLTLDLQYQRHHWNLDQKIIGHFPGYQISANWDFFNPRVGAYYSVTEEFSLFTNYGIARKEPADDQILNADDVWDTPRAARPEKISDFEVGFDHHGGKRSLKVNYYLIHYQNEVLTDIYNFEDTQFEVESADRTIHTGLEFETALKYSDGLSFNFNGTFSSNYYASGELKNRQLMNTPQQLYNFSMDFTAKPFAGLSLLVKYVGRQYIDDRNSRELSIEPYVILNSRVWFKFNRIQLNFTINNIFDKLYSTYGYSYYGGYYWPGAARNMYLEIKYDF